jgi:hypothetical protein
MTASRDNRPPSSPVSPSDSDRTHHLQVMGVGNRSNPLRSGAGRQLVIFAIICVGMAGAIAAIIWSAGGFDAGALSGNGLAALIIGSVLSLLLTVLLMGLVFYSNRSEMDRDVHDAHRSDRE